MALSYALTTLDRQKSFMQISVSTHDTILDRLIDAATDYIENYCDRRFQSTTYTNELYDGTDYPQMQLNQYPIITFTQLDKRDTATNEDNWSTIDTELYFVTNDNGILTLVGSTNLSFNVSSVFVKLPQHYRVTYTAGYDYDNSTTFLSSVGSGTNAADLEYACWKLVTAIFNQRKSQGNVQRERIGDYEISFTREVAIDDELKGILTKYRRIPH